MSKIRVLVCDDSALMRKSISKIIESDPDLEVVGIARDGNDGVAKARDLKPDVITMDINMPGMDGITALQIIVNEGISPVIMVSSLTEEGAVVTFEAMALGAFDYVAKPGGTISKEMGSVEKELISKIKAATGKGTLKRLTRSKPKPEIISKAPKRESRPIKPSSGKALNYKAVVIGISTGGPKTIYDVLPHIPADLNAAIFIVQHMPPAFTNSYAKRLDDNCPMKCVETVAGMVAEPGVIYVAQGGYHLTIYKKLTGKIFIRSQKSPEHLFMPSVDVMMDSVLSVFGNQTIGVLMTGMGDDGADAMVKINEYGGETIAESEESAIVFGMPQEAIKRGGANIVVPSWEIADEIIKAVKHG